MPIKKIIGIKYVGRLVNCAQKGPEFNRYNLFFAENGRGKTTLCAVLRSLQTGQHEYITERKTLTAIWDEPTATIRIDGGQAKYEKNAWSSTVPEIAIFDATFVTQNVHAGEFIGRDHRTNLLQIIIGQAGLALAKKVNDLDEAIREKNGEIGSARKLVQQHLPKGVGIDAFINLPEDPDIDTKISTKTTELVAAKRANEIKTHAALSEVNIPILPANLLPTLGKTLADVSAEAERRLREQIANHEMHENGEAWLSEGVGYIRNDKCPFCGQSVEGLPLVQAYKQFFSDAYRQLHEEIEQLQTDAESALGDVTLATLGGIVAANDGAVEFWRQFTPISVALLDHDRLIAAPTRELKKAVVALIARKLASPLEAVQPDATFTVALSEYETAKQILKTYIAQVKVANASIQRQKDQAQAANVVAIERDLAALKLTKLRFDEKVKPLCTAYKTSNADKDKLDKAKDASKAALDKHADKMIRDYEATINTLLKGFGAGFQITNSKKTYVGGTPSSTYQILIDNMSVDLGDSGTPIGQRCFRTTLSSGDKSTLALAFFLAQLDRAGPGNPDRVLSWSLS